MEAVPAEVATAARIIWDFDGVITDNEPVQVEAYETVLARRGVSLPPNWFSSWVGAPEREIWRGLRASTGTAEDPEKLMLERAEVYLPLAEELTPAWFVAPLLALDCEHHIVSANDYDQIVHLLSVWGLASSFTSVSAAHAPSGDIRGKAQRLADRLEPGCVLIEDSPKYLSLARGVTRVGVSHGFNALSALDCEMEVAHASPGQWGMPQP